VRGVGRPAPGSPLAVRKRRGGRGADHAAPRPPRDRREARILAVDDDTTVLRLMRRQLAAGGFTHFHALTDPARAAEAVREVDPDLVVLDLHMGAMSGLEVLELLRPVLAAREGYLPVLVVSGDAAVEARREALSRGARDFLAKPYDTDELLLRIGNLLEMRWLHEEVQARNRTLEETVRARTRALARAHLEVVERLARAGDWRDDETGHHTRRVGELSARIARALGLPEERVEQIRAAAPLHDVGKIGTPDAVLLKPGRLTPEERALMETHTTCGAELLASGGSPLVRLAERIARSHHERWDGTGYPHRLAGRQIPLEARIVAVADVFDALSHDRPYRPALPRDVVLAKIRDEAGKHFDPRVVQAFLRVAGRRRLARPHRRRRAASPLRREAVAARGNDAPRAADQPRAAGPAEGAGAPASSQHLAASASENTASGLLRMSSPASSYMRARPNDAPGPATIAIGPRTGGSCARSRRSAASIGDRSAASRSTSSPNSGSYAASLRSRSLAAPSPAHPSGPVKTMVISRRSRSIS
jgi:putative two-component system response regulator